MRMILPMSLAGFCASARSLLRSPVVTNSVPSRAQDETRAEVKRAVGGGLLPEDDLHVFEVGAVALRSVTSLARATLVPFSADPRGSP